MVLTAVSVQVVELPLAKLAGAQVLVSVTAAACGRMVIGTCRGTGVLLQSDHVECGKASLAQRHVPRVHRDVKRRVAIGRKDRSCPER